MTTSLSRQWAATPVLIAPVLGYGIALVLVDETGDNPLPPGVFVSLVDSADASVVLSGYTLPGGAVSLALYPGHTYVVSFRGLQAPDVTATFTAGWTVNQIAVPGYRSPTLSTLGYTQAQAELWPIGPGWFGDVARAPGGNAYAVAYAFGAILAALDAQAQRVLADMRAESSIGGTDELDTWAADFLGASFLRAPGEVDVSFLGRLFERLQARLTTLACIQAVVTSYVQVFFPVIGLPVPTSITVFDRQSNATLADKVGIAPPEFCILFGNPNPAQPTNVWYLEQSHLDVTTFLGADATFAIVSAPSSGLAELVNSIKALGTIPVYAVANA